MSHFAKVFKGRVLQVLVAEKDFLDSYVDNIDGEWIQTSYNTRGGIHYGQDGQPDGGVALRGNYAGVGFTYDYDNDVFYEPQPFPSWILNKTTWSWEPPVARPNDGIAYTWNEKTTSWVAVPVTE